MAPTTVKMIAFLTFLLTTMLFSLPAVHAGHVLWEPPADLFRTDWITINPEEGGNLAWPNKEIKYCYPTNMAEKKLDHWLRAGMQLWYAAGLPSDYKMTQQNYLSCIRNRANVVVIQYVEGLMSSDLGMLPPTYGSPGATAEWHVPKDPRGTVGVFAHEIGHLFGLFHEHQNLMFWGPHGNQRLFEFACEELWDFNAKTQGLSHEQIWGLGGICTDYFAAAGIDFSASQYLPLPLQLRLLQPWGYLTRDENVDWPSLMMYDSYLGSDKQRRVLWRRKDNTDIVGSSSPSQLDVAGLRYLYHVRTAYPRHRLLNDPRSPYFARFKRFAPGC